MVTATKKLFASKTALVTGGASGIGWATACELARAGTEVAICSRAGKSLDQAADRIKESGHRNIRCYQADVSSESDMLSLFEELSVSFNQLDFLVNNAGIDSICDLDNFSINSFRRVVDVNVTSVFIAVTNALPLMRNAKAAAVVNVGSIHGHVTTSGRSDYVTSKTALIGATRSLALDLAADRIRVNMVSPGAVETPMLMRGWKKKAPDIKLSDLRQRIGKLHPCGRIGDPLDIAYAIRFLLSEEASFITGTDLNCRWGHAHQARSSKRLGELNALSR